MASKIYSFVKIIVLGLVLLLSIIAFATGCKGATKISETTPKPIAVAEILDTKSPEPIGESAIVTDPEPILETEETTQDSEPTETVKETELIRGLLEYIPDETKISDTEPVEIETTIVEPIPITVSINELYETDRDLYLYGTLSKNDVSKELKTLLDNYGKKIALVCWSIDGSKAISYNSEATFHSGCTIKMPYFLYCCEEMDQGNDSPDAVMVYEERHWHGGSGQIRYAPFGSQYTLSTLVTLGLSISDNVAYEMLFERFGVKGYNEYIKDKGCLSLQLRSMWPSKVKASDFVRIWYDVYNYLNADKPNSELLKTACTNTVFAYGMKRIEGVNYAHKSGHQYEPWPGYNDAGIVYTDTPYIYAIFTASEGTDYDQGVIQDAMALAHELMK